MCKVARAANFIIYPFATTSSETHLKSFNGSNAHVTVLLLAPNQVKAVGPVTTFKGHIVGGGLQQAL